MRSSTSVNPRMPRILELVLRLGQTILVVSDTNPDMIIPLASIHNLPRIRLSEGEDRRRRWVPREDGRRALPVHPENAIRRVSHSRSRGLAAPHRGRSRRKRRLSGGLGAEFRPAHGPVALNSCVT